MPSNRQDPFKLFSDYPTNTLDINTKFKFTENINNLNLNEILELSSIKYTDVLPTEKTLSAILSCYKSDKLGDPLVAREHIYAFEWSSPKELDYINEQCLRINDFLLGMFKGIGIKLVDFKLEFGKRKSDGKIILADEISPDTCRLWDADTDKKLDKDRFRKDLGDVVEAYQEVARRLGILHEQVNNIRPIKFPKPTAVKMKKK